MIVLHYAIFGVFSAFIGVFLLYKAWQSKKNRIDLRILGWGFLIASLVSWAFSAGHDRGVALGLIIICLTPLIFITLQAYKDKPIARAVGMTPVNKTKKNNKTNLFLVTIKYVWVSIGCGFVALISSIAIHEILWQQTIHTANSLVFTLFLFPIFWASYSSYTVISKNKRQQVTVFILLSAFSLITLFSFNHSVIL